MKLDKNTVIIKKIIKKSTMYTKQIIKEVIHL